MHPPMKMTRKAHTTIGLACSDGASAGLAFCAKACSDTSSMNKLPRNLDMVTLAIVLLDSSVWLRYSTRTLHRSCGGFQLHEGRTVTPLQASGSAHVPSARAASPRSPRRARVWQVPAGGDRPVSSGG